MYFGFGTVCGMLIYLFIFLVCYLKFDKDKYQEISQAIVPIVLGLFVGVVFALVKAIKMLGLC